MLGGLLGRAERQHEFVAGPPWLCRLTLPVAPFALVGIRLPAHPGSAIVTPFAIRLQFRPDRGPLRALAKEAAGVPVG